MEERFGCWRQRGLLVVFIDIRQGFIMRPCMGKHLFRFRNGWLDRGDGTKPHPSSKMDRHGRMARQRGMWLRASSIKQRKTAVRDTCGPLKLRLLTD